MVAGINKGPAFGQRHVQVLLLFTAIVVNYVAKFNASVAIVAMTSANTTNPDFPEYHWNDMHKSYIQSSFFWGYFLTQFPGGYLCRRFGAKTTLFYSTFGSSFLCLLPPLCVSWGGWVSYCVIRIMQGLFQGLLFPTVYAHLAAWSPINERNRLGALANTGMECGTLLSMFVSGIIASSSIGWPGLFYVTGSMGLVWCLAWLILSACEPSASKFITRDELNYINASKNMPKALETGESERKVPVPWRAILTSVPLWALVAARSAYSWGFDSLQSQIPSYMKNVLQMDMSKNAIYSALPYLAMWCMSYVFLIVSDVLLRRKVLTLTAIRKIYNTIALWIPAVGLIAVGFLNKTNTTLVIVLITVTVGLLAAATIGSALNAIDLSPNYAGIVMGIVNTGANIVPILTPLLVSAVVKDRTDHTQWQLVFMIAAAVFLFTNLFYMICGQMKVQPWDDANFLLSQSATIEKKAGEETVQPAF